MRLCQHREPGSDGPFVYDSRRSRKCFTAIQNTRRSVRTVHKDQYPSHGTQKQGVSSLSYKPDTDAGEYLGIRHSDEVRPQKGLMGCVSCIRLNQYCVVFATV
jgi:hypothetical protein